VNNQDCPKQAPEPEASCAGHVGEHCYYPLEDCACATAGGNWKCNANPKPDSPPMEVTRPSWYSTPGVAACILDLPAELCVKNVRSRPDCTATVGELDDCVETILAAGFSGWVGHGCAPLMSNPTCQNVIAQPISKDNPTQCETPLE